MFCTLKEIASFARGRQILTDPNRSIETLLTDSRALVANPGSSLFFALRTDVGDGHNYLRRMLDKGVRSFVVSRLPEDTRAFVDCNFIIVDSPWELLRRIGAETRRCFKGSLVAVTGSRGKTTLKEYLFQALSPLTDVTRSPRSFNSRLGVPLSLWRLPDTDGVGIIEAGISRPGEMESLAEIIRPDIVVFTNIGDEHGENFRSRHAIATEKALLARDASRIVCSDIYPELIAALDTVAHHAERFLWSFTDPKATLYISLIEPDGSSAARLTYIYNGEEHTLRAPFAAENAADMENVASAMATILALGYDPSTLGEAIARMAHVDTRLDMVQAVNGCKLIYDSFTPDFESLETALDFLKRRADGLEFSRTLILGDLSCNPKEEKKLYARTAEIIRSADIDRLICVGPELSRHAALFPEKTTYFESPAAFLAECSTSDFASEIILVKGADPGMETIRTILEARTHETVLEVNLDAIVRNFNYFKSHLPASTGLVAMVKASGYGAGSVEIAKTLQEHGAAYLAVAVLDEGIELRRSGITMPIMVMNPKVVNYRAMFAYNLEPEIYCTEMLEDVVREAAKNGVKGYPVHIKLDTGMHRMGFNAEELPALAARLRECTEITPASVFSHLATADCPDMDDYTMLQLDRFREYTQYLLDNCGHTFKRHILNSAGILRFPEHHYDMARLGIGLYGCNTLPPEMEKPLDNVSTLRTVVIAVKERDEGETIGYGRRGVLSRKSRIATIPIGYADGMNRHFGNGHSKVWINGHLAPTIGNICMDACMIDVTDIPCRPGDVVEIFGPHVPVQRLADILDTIPYEILTSVSPRVKRIYYRE